MDEHPDIRTVTLEKLKFGLAQTISQEMIDAHITTVDDWLYNQVRLEIRGFIWAETLESDEFKWPADWWEAFKERWFPKWALRRWPVRYERHKLDVKAAYPNLRPSVPDQQYVIHILEDWGHRRE